MDHTLSVKTAKFTSLENLYEYGMYCIYMYVITLFVYSNVLVSPMIDDSASTSDVLLDIDDDNLFSLTLNCPIKRSSPTPTVVWLHNGLPIATEELDTGLVLYTQKVSPIATGYDYTLRIVSDNGTYQFVLDNIIGMYQCIANNEAGQVIINQRVLFKCKLICYSI